MITIRKYIEGIFIDIPSSDEKKDVMQEIILNLEEKVADLVEQGKSEEDAINKSIVDFGDGVEIKNDLMPAGTPAAKKKNINYTNRLWFSVWGSVLLIGLFIFINFYYSPRAIWFVYPTFAILWWPLAAFFARLNSRKK